LGYLQEFRKNLEFWTKKRVPMEPLFQKKKLLLLIFSF